MSNHNVFFCPCIHTAPFSPCGSFVWFLFFGKYNMPPTKRVPCQCGLDLSRSPSWHSDGTSAKKCIRAKQESVSMFAPKAKKVKKDAK